MPKPKPWTPTEDAIIRENADMGPSWEGYALLLPGRSKTAIMSRRQKLGVQFTRGGARDKAEHRRPRQKRAESSTAWTAEQTEALVLCMQEMTEKTNHTVNECLVEFARIVRAYKAERGMMQ